MNKQSRMKRAVQNYKTELTMLGVFCVFFAVMSIVSPNFLSSQNMLNVASQVSANAMLSVGMTLVIITGGIDLSVGGILGLSGMIGSILMVQTKNSVVGFITIMAVALICGLINGILIGYIKMPAFIVTLGMMNICRSLDYVISDANTQSGFPQSWQFIGKQRVMGIPMYLILMVIVFIIFAFILQKTKFGRFLYACGSNADATYGSIAEMDAIAAAVIGGTSMSGGKGTIGGTVVGIFLVGFLRNALNLLGINPYWQGSALGAVIVVAVLAERISRMRHKKA